jgi:hypothetical protein
VRQLAGVRKLLKPSLSPFKQRETVAPQGRLAGVN